MTRIAADAAAGDDAVGCACSQVWVLEDEIWWAWSTWVSWMMTMISLQHALAFQKSYPDDEVPSNFSASKVVDDEFEWAVVENPLFAEVLVTTAFPQIRDEMSLAEIVPDDSVAAEGGGMEEPEDA